MARRTRHPPSRTLIVTRAFLGWLLTDAPGNELMDARSRALIVTLRDSPAATDHRRYVVLDIGRIEFRLALMTALSPIAQRRADAAARWKASLTELTQSLLAFQRHFGGQSL